MMLTWTNQPKELEACEVVGTIRLLDDIAEVRVGQDRKTWFVTVGNLFDSQTIRCDDTATLVRVLAVASGKARNLKLPPGGVMVS